MRKLYVILILLFVGVFQLNAKENFKPNNSTVFSVSSNWELVKTENGINVYYSIYEEASGQQALKIKFENKTNQTVNSSWSLKKNGSYLFEDVKLNIDAFGIYDFDYTAIMIPFDKNDLFNDFKITFLQKK